MLEASEIAEEAESLVGTTLGGLYRVDAKIGEGGMGTVYRAVHVHLEKPFAVKVLGAEASADARAIARLHAEAKTASHLAHPHIVEVTSFDVDRSGPAPRSFLVMELLEGRSLTELVAEGPMPVARALHVTRQIADALAAAHAHGVVHRDLKPDNVFLIAKDGDADFVKVLDFGISKVRNATAERVRVTHTGQLVGTPLYLSPEQARGDLDPDHRADVYSLGVMLYEMLAGAPPFVGTNAFQLLWKHGNEAPTPIVDRRAGLPAPLAAAVMRALEKDPAARFDSMETFVAALDARETAARRTTRARLGWALVAIAAAGIVAVLASADREEPAAAPSPPTAPATVAAALPDPAPPTEAPRAREPARVVPSIEPEAVRPAAPSPSRRRAGASDPLPIKQSF